MDKTGQIFSTRIGFLVKKTFILKSFLALLFLALCKGTKASNLNNGGKLG